MPSFRAAFGLFLLTGVCGNSVSATNTGDDILFFDAVPFETASEEWTTFDGERSKKIAENVASSIKLGRQPIRYAPSDADVGAEDFGVAVSFRVPVSELTFVQTQSLLDSTLDPQAVFGFRQSLGYGLHFFRTDRVHFSLAPGIAGGYDDDAFASFEDRFAMLGNINQSLTFQFNEDLTVSQEFNYFIQRVEEDNLAAFMNLDLETLLSESLSFRVSYEVKYDDTASEEMELRESRISTAIGFRF